MLLTNVQKLQRKGLLNQNEIENILKYIEERKCTNGGYCFYRQDEANSSDTYYAIAIQKLVDEKSIESSATISYLHGLQHPDGGFFSIIQAYYVINTLSLFLSSPTKDPSQFILDKYHSFHDQNLPVEISVFRKIYFLTSLTTTLKHELYPELKKEIISFILSFRNQDYGFGSSNLSTLTETMQAVQILNWLDFPINEINNVTRFISSCNSPHQSFTNIPGTSLSFLEYIHAGFIVSRMLSYKPKYLDTTLKLVKGCQTTLGGFSRTPYTGIATLENTFYAVDTLFQLIDLL